MMQQYLKIKSQYKDAILLFRLGDFYEAFFEDAQIVSKALDLVLTQRQGAPMAGVPYHALNSYLKRLVQLGYKVAICDQMEDPATAKGLVRREVTRIVTPGTLIEDELLESDSNNYLVVIVKDAEKYHLAVVDVSTGDSLVASFENLDATVDFIKSLKATQILCDSSLKPTFDGISGVLVEQLQDWHLSPYNAAQDVAKAFKVVTIDHLELGESLKAYAAAIRYLRYTMMAEEIMLKPPKLIREEKFVILDSTTIEHLNLIEPKGKSLFDVLNYTKTAMGSRLLKTWILQPLRDLREISARLEKVQAFVEDQILLNELREYLSAVRDLHRIASRLRYNKVLPKDLVALKSTLEVCPRIRELLLTNEAFSDAENLDCLSNLCEELSKALEDEPSNVVGEGQVIRQGYDKQLDELKELVYHSEKFLEQYEHQERVKTAIPNLRVGYNSVFGYYIEVTKSHLSKVPQNYIRRQTLVNAERFVTEELKKFEEKILHSKELLEKREKELFESLCQKALSELEKIVVLADFISKIDVLQSLAYAASLNKYSRPRFSNERNVVLVKSRHPIAEKFTENFVPNDITLSEQESFVILTGPNMSGKSTFVRQIGLVSLMAQIGSFVPAAEAILPIFDRIFVKMGVRDDITTGRSTFLTEMNEIAKIIHQATRDSLVLLDEVGRGTSTFDGISIAWAISEYLHTKIGCKCVFATHFTELTELANLYEGVANKTIEVTEEGSQVIFLHKVVDGVADKSYGIDVAAIAGLPLEVVQRAREILDVIASKSELEDRLRVVSSEKLKKIKKKRVNPDQTALW